MTKLWTWLEGKKTHIGLMLASIAQIMALLSPDLLARAFGWGPQGLAILTIVSILFAAYGRVHAEKRHKKQLDAITDEAGA